MSKFRSAPRTIVTEIKAFVVDSVSRSGVFRQSVSARVADSEPLNRQDVNITKERFYEVDDVSSVLGIMSPELVKVELIQVSTSVPPEEPEEPVPEPMFDLPETIFIGDDFVIRLIDKNILPVSAVLVTVMDSTTGETEEVRLERIEEGVFEGSIRTQQFTGLTNNFDDILLLQNGSEVLLQYQGNEGSTYMGTVDVVSPYVDSVISSISTLFPGRPLPISVDDIDLSGEGSVSVQVMNTTTGLTTVVELLEFEAGHFQGLFDTTESLETGKITVTSGQSLSINFTSPKYADSPTSEFTVQALEEQYVPAFLEADDSVEPGQTLVVTLNDYNKAGVGALDIVVSNLQTREYVILRCEEVMPSSGIFYGELDTARTSATGVLRVIEGQTVESVYVDTGASEPVRLTASTSVSSSVVPVPMSSPVESDAPVLVENKVDFLVDGLFFFNGNFRGKLRVYGLTSDPVRCSILHS